ncbi:tripartite tricarboxylate transporter TctB family protein [Litchfieldella xinjiangensis]|uniref:tripartite tricarboxylate transporter TctB family protein n=1 Tax=Litchfieldella xinjiangensis TaxID=1166948 RepID=UPI0005BD09A3|nr:tripartite tricarboxylate transporter TctB family protein [Halomonas xinjiangensis]
MSLQRSRDGRLLVPVALLLVTTLYFFEAWQLGPPMRNGNMTASFFPMAIAIIMYLAIAQVIWRILRSPPERETTDDHAATRRLGPLWVTLATAGYLLAFSTLGYFVSTTVYVFVLTLLYGEGFRGLPLKLIASVIITVAGYLLFEVVFRVRLPTLWSL